MYGLVLEGGGAKGAYHIGSYFALIELGFKFDAVVGTSIGSFNGAMIAMGQADKCAQMWRSKSLNDYTTEEIEEGLRKVRNLAIPQLSVELLGSIHERIHSIGNTGLSVEPLKNLVEENIDEDLLRKSKIKFGLVTLNLTDKKGEELFVDDIPYGELKKYIVASCYFPAFKLEKLDGKYYLDGGFYNNIPYNMVQNLGLKPIIVRANPKDIKDLAFPKDAIVIEPRIRYLKSLEFDPIKAEELMRIGYFDTYKVINNLSGIKYYIEDFDEKQAVDELERLSEKGIYYEENENHALKYRELFEKIVPNIAKEFSLGADFTYKEIVINLVEKYAQMYNIDYLRIYKISELINLILDREYIRKTEKNSLVQNLGENHIGEFLKRMLK